WANEGLAEAANELEGLDTASSSSSTGYTCQTYIENLYAETDAPIHRQFVSRLWEAGYLPAFYVSQFSDPEVGHLLGCRLLEADAGIPPHEQAAIQGGGMDPSFFISLGDSGETRQIKL